MGCTRPNSGFGESAEGSTGAGETGESTNATATGAMTGSADGTTTGGSPTTSDDGPPPDDDTTTGDPGSSSDDGTTGEPDEPAGILFINFDGAVLSSGPDDASLDQTILAAQFSGSEAAPYGDGPKRADIINRLAELWSPFDILITPTRPAQGDYAMVIVTPSNPFGGPTLGVASPDCGNANPRSVGFAFGEVDDATPAELMALAVSRSAGRGYGLDQVEGPDIMGAQPPIGAMFVDDCLPLDVTGTAPACTHTDFCGPGEQNSFAELASYFPPR